LLALLVLVLSLNASFSILCAGGLEDLCLLFWVNYCLLTIMSSSLMGIYVLLDK
jgi:hypothetical protein